MVLQQKWGPPSRQARETAARRSMSIRHRCTGLDSTRRVHQSIVVGRTIQIVRAWHGGGDGDGRISRRSHHARPTPAQRRGRNEFRLRLSLPLAPPASGLATPTARHPEPAGRSQSLCPIHARSHRLDCTRPGKITSGSRLMTCEVRWSRSLHAYFLVLCTSFVTLNFFFYFLFR